MIKTLVIIVIVATLVFQLIAYILTKEVNYHYSDEELRQTALSRNMSSVPDTYEELLKLVDTPKNRLSKDKIALGKDLYFDKILSKERDISCATCHMITKEDKKNDIFSSLLLSTEKPPQKDCVVCHLSDQSGTDRFETAVGHNQQENFFHLNTQSILNAALAKYQTWSGEIETVEEQAGVSIQDPFKMSLSATDAVERLSHDSLYREKFKKVFDNKNSTVPTLTFDNIQKAIGAYVKTLLTRSDYDRFLDGDNNAISQEAKKGLSNFINFGCKGCHTGRSVGGQSIQKFPLRDYNSFLDLTNTFNEDVKGRKVSKVSFNFEMYHPFPFENIGGYMGKDGQRLFRVPILRNITKTSPYFHNGAVKKLRDTVYLMAKHQLGMNLTETQIDEIIAFLKTLEGDIVNYSIEDGENL